MSYPSTGSSLETYRGSSDEDVEETPRANRIRANPFMAYGPPPPQTDPPRTYDAPMNYYNDEFEEADRRWTAGQSLMRHLRPMGGEEEGYGREHDPPSRHYGENEWWNFDELTTFDDRTACVGVWLLACMSALVILGGAAVIWILVTQ